MLHAGAPDVVKRYVNSGPSSGADVKHVDQYHGVGLLKLPLPADQAAGLKAVAQQAPHGKGMETVVDTAVRDALQVDASQVSIASSWDATLKHLVSDVSKGLALTDNAGVNVSARLYKLLLYEQGGHFKPHQDTEKERGMIGTLVVQLPVEGGHTGGCLTVRHMGETFTHNFEQGSADSLQYAAFFADCEHELSPISSGMRLVLVYNLVWVGLGKVPSAAADRRVQERLQKAYKLWEEELATGDCYGLVAFRLEHEYTKANLRFEHLKGRDRAMAHALASIPGFTPYLMLVTRTLTGRGETDAGMFGGYYGGYGGGLDEPDPDDYTMGEVEFDKCETSKWVARDGSTIQGDFDPAEEEEMFYDPTGKLLFGSTKYPDEATTQGYTGNEGVTLEHIYRTALLVITIPEPQECEL